MLRCDPRVFRAFGVPREFDAIACGPDRCPNGVQAGELERGADRAAPRVDDPWTDAEWARFHEARLNRELETFYERGCKCR